MEAPPAAEKRTIEARDASALFKDFLFGQRAVLGIVDQQLVRGIFSFLEMAIVDFCEAHERVAPTTFHRFLMGEFTNGTPPIERTAQNLPRLRSIECFATVLELLRMRADGPIPLPKPKSKADDLFRGRLGPYVLLRVDDEKRAMCWHCRVEQPYDLLMATDKPLPCSNCGATDTDGTDATIDGGARTD